MTASSKATINPCGSIPLIDAAFRHDYPQVQVLLANGADVNTRNVCGQTALTAAAEFDDDGKLVDLLLKHGAKVNIRTSSSASALVLAASGNNISSARLLLKHGADIEARQSNWTPLIASIDNDDNAQPQPSDDLSEFLDMEKLLIDNGADVNAKRGGKTALMAAEQRHLIRTMALLKQHGAK
jgi:ankyrin repeat protein